MSSRTLYDCRFNNATYAQPCDGCDLTCSRVVEKRVLPDRLTPIDPAVYWHQQFQYALSGLSWAVGALGEDAGYAGRVHERLTNPVVAFPSTEIHDALDEET